MDSNINRTGLSETNLRNSSPRVPKLSRIMTTSEPTSPSLSQRSRLSLDRSFANSTISSERRSPKVPTPPEKTRTRSSVNGSSESQPRLIQVKKDLRKANELIASLESEKAKALYELELVREEAYEKLYEALEAQKMAKENFEIEKFKAVEAGVEASQRKEEELKKELEIVKNQHASDSAVLLLVTRELEKVTQELAAANDAKNMLLGQAEDANKKVDVWSSELVRLKALLDSTREKETISKKEIASKLGAEILALKSELEKARCFEAEVKERNMVIEKLNAEIEVMMMAKSYVQGSADQWCTKARELEEQLEEANMMKRSAEKQLEGFKEELSKIEREAAKLKIELESVKEEKRQGLKREQDAASSVQMLLEENRKILSELERSKEEEEKSSKAMESLASALHEVSSEARELKEKLLSLGSQDYETHVEDLKLVIKSTNEKYEKMLHEVEQTKKQFEISRVDWEIRETGLVNHVKRFDEEVYLMEKEMNRLGNLVKRTKEEADAAREKESQTRDDLKEAEDEVIYLQETLREARAESLKLNAKILDKETEFQSVLHENDLLRGKQDVSLKKIKDLSKLLEEALDKKEEDNGELSESEQDYDLVDFSEENGHRS